MANQENKTKTAIIKSALSLYLKNKKSKLSSLILHRIANSEHKPNEYIWEYGY